MIEAHHVICEAILECKRRNLEPHAANVASIVSHWLAKEWERKMWRAPGFERGTQPELVHIDARKKPDPL